MCRYVQISLLSRRVITDFITASLVLRGPKGGSAGEN